MGLQRGEVALIDIIPASPPMRNEVESRTVERHVSSASNASRARSNPRRIERWQRDSSAQ